MKILEEKENFLLNRKEVKVIVEAEKNPSYGEVMNLLIDKFKTDKDRIVINRVKGKFGRNTFLINAFIYKTKEDKEKYEVKKKKKETPTTPPEHTQTTPPPQPQTQEQKPVEEKKEEEKEEVKEEKPEEKPAEEPQEK